MRKIFLVSLVACLGSLSAKAADLSRCSSGIGLSYTMGPNGKLIRPANDPDLISYSNKNGQETAVLKASPNTMRNEKFTFTVHSEGGRPLTYKIKTDTMAAETQFGYEGDNCYVAEMTGEFSNFTDKKPYRYMAYNKDFCDKILQASAAFSEDKIRECGQVFSAVESIRNQYQSKLAKRGLHLAAPMSGIIFPAKPNKEAVTTPTAFDLMAGCKMARQIYRTDGLKSSPSGQGGGFTGGGFAPGPGIGATGGGFSGTGKEEPESDSAE